MTAAISNSNFRNVQPNQAPKFEATPQVESAPENQDSFEVQLHISGVQDEKHPEAAESFNRNLLAKASEQASNWQPPAGEGGGSFESFATPVYSDANLTVIDLSYEAYTANTAHPSNAVDSFLYDRRSGKEAKLDDLFADKKHGREQLYGLIQEDLKRQGSEEAEFANYYINSDSEDLSAFHPTKEGLAFMVPSERTGPYGAGVFEAVIPWSNLNLDPKGPLKQP